MSDKKTDKVDQKDSSVSSRRKALTAGAMGVVAWKTPVLNAVVTPAHAQTSMTTTVAPTTAAPTMQIVTVAAASFGGTLSIPATN